MVPPQEREQEEMLVDEREQEEVVKAGDYVLVQFVGAGKTEQPVHYVGRVTGEKVDGLIKISYYRKAEGPMRLDMFAFKSPIQPDLYNTDPKDIKVKLELAEVTKSLLLFNKSKFNNLVFR